MSRVLYFFVFDLNAHLKKISPREYRQQRLGRAYALCARPIEILTTKVSLGVAMKRLVFSRVRSFFVLLICCMCTSSSADKVGAPNLLISLPDKDLGGFQWINEPDYSFSKDGVLTVTSGPQTDFFIDPQDGKSSASAPVLYREVSGDFVAIALVQPDLTHTWNAASIMVFIDDDNWIKFAFENSDATGNSIVSVVTRGVSDDANGVRLNDSDRIWLKLVRKGDSYAMHWSEDGQTYQMARLSKMPSADIVKVGLEAQSPLEYPATHSFHHFSLETKTVGNLRTGL